MNPKLSRRSATLGIVSALAAGAGNPFATVACADSIWARRNARVGYLFADTNARRVGDLLTIVIRENTDIENNDQRKMDKQSEAGGTFQFAGDSSGGLAGLSADADVNALATSRRRFDGSAQFSSAREFLDRITVTVIDVLPNGNLLVAGKRSRVVAGEERSLLISGIVRPTDIRSGNFVQSQHVGNFQIRYEGKGPESSFANQGWLGRAVNRVWPF